mgnify:CR=1 FL=1
MASLIFWKVTPQGGANGPFAPPTGATCCARTLTVNTSKLAQKTSELVLGVRCRIEKRM